MVELNYSKLQKYLHDLVNIKGENPSQITKNSGVWNIKKMMNGENEPTLKSWCKLHEAYPKDILEPEYTDGNMVYKSVSVVGNENVTGRDMTFNKNKSSDLSPEEQTLIKLLRQKDPTHVFLMRCIADLIMRENPE